MRCSHDLGQPERRIPDLLNLSEEEKTRYAEIMKAYIQTAKAFTQLSAAHLTSANLPITLFRQLLALLARNLIYFPDDFEDGRIDLLMLDVQGRAQCIGHRSSLRPQDPFRLLLS
jgi:hypothetical protein